MNIQDFKIGEVVCSEGEECEIIEIDEAENDVRILYPDGETVWKNVEDFYYET